MSAKIFMQDDKKTVELTVEELREVIRGAVDEAIDHKCRLPLNDAQVQEVGHVFGMIKDVGGSDLAKGVEEIRINHKWLGKIRTCGEKIGTGLILLFLGACLSGAGTALWIGFKHLVGVPPK